MCEFAYIYVPKQLTEYTTDRPNFTLTFTESRLTLIASSLRPICLNKAHIGDALICVPLIA